jgi:UDP-N-acetylmuramoyl-tripeptide--D-alanyl-D-alanine ligase
MRMRGLPNILNALAASAVAVSRGVPVEAIARGLGIARSSPRRGQWLSFQEGFTVIDDTYNSNEHALLCAVQTMREYQGKHVRLFLVAGEMAEIGMTSQEVHRRCGFALGSLVDIVWGVCGAAIHLVEGARNAGAKNTMMFENAIAAADALRAVVRDGDLILIKGSRSARMEVVVDLLLTHFHCLPDVELEARC